MRLSRNLHYDSVVPKGKRSYPLGVQQRFFVLFSVPKLVRALLNQRALQPSHRHCPGVPPEEMRTFDCASCFRTKCTNSTQQVSARSYSLATRILHLRILFCRGVARKSWFSVWPAKLLPRILRCGKLPMETEVHAIALDSAPLASRRPLFAPCLPSTCSRACVQSPCGSLRFNTLTVLNRGELAVVCHCKFAEMFYSSDELVVVVCFFSKTASIFSTTTTGQPVKSVYAFTHYAFGASRLRASPCLGLPLRFSRPRSSTWTYSFFCISSISLFTCMRIACSSSLSSLLNFQVAWSGVRLASRAFPPTTVSSSLGFFYEAFPHSEVRCLWTILWCGPLSLLHCVFVGWVLLLEQTDVLPVCGQARQLPSFPVRPLFHV